MRNLVKQNVGNFLTSWESVAFSRGCILCGISSLIKFSLYDTPLGTATVATAHRNSHHSTCLRHNSRLISGGRTTGQFSDSGVLGSAACEYFRALRDKGKMGRWTVWHGCKDALTLNLITDAANTPKTKQNKTKTRKETVNWSKRLPNTLPLYLLPLKYFSKNSIVLGFYCCTSLMFDELSVNTKDC
jgi:hypothetical protein